MKLFILLSALLIAGLTVYYSYNPGNPLMLTILITALLNIMISLILIGTRIYRKIKRKVSAKHFWSVLLFTSLNVFITLLCIRITDYYIDTLLVVVKNDYDVTVNDFGLFGCEAEYYGNLKAGETKRLRLHRGGCAYQIQYSINRKPYIETLPVNYGGSKSKYILGKHPNEYDTTFRSFFQTAINH